MARKKKIEMHSYKEGSIRYLACQICGHYEVVGDETTAVKCSRCVSMIMMNKYPYEEPKSYKPTGRPAGWHWMTEFVDKDSTYDNIIEIEDSKEMFFMDSKSNWNNGKTYEDLKEEVLEEMLMGSLLNGDMAYA